MSLLGRPLNYKTSRRDVRYRRLQSRIYNFLERPRGYKAISYHMLVFCIIFMCLTLSVLSTIEEYEEVAFTILFYFESCVVVWFTIEFFLRLWSSGCRSRYQGLWGRLKYIKRPFCCVDIVTICASLVVLAVRTDGQVFAASAIRGLRFFQILRMVRMDRRGGTWKLLGSVVYAHRQELITTLYIGFLGLIFASFLVYLAEKDVNDNFRNFADALWWGVITLCTVGYGDAVPKTWQGKMIASGCALLGISFFALPAGILGSGFALKVQQQQRQKHMIRRRQPAATLIQCLWRCYAADEHSMSVATWKIHQVPLPSPPSRQISFKHNASFVTRLPTIRRHRHAHSPSIKTRHTDSNHYLDNMVNSNRLNASHSEDSVTKESSEVSFGKKNSDDEDDEQPRVLQLTNQHKGAIRAIRKIRFFIARRKFKEALKPYDVKDVIEQYSSGHADLLTRVKVLHGRLDQILGKQGSKSKDVYESKICVASRIVKVERQVDDIEAKLDQLIDLYMEDRKRLVSLPSASYSGSACMAGAMGGGGGGGGGRGGGEGAGRGAGGGVGGEGGSENAVMSGAGGGAGLGSPDAVTSSPSSLAPPSMYPLTPSAPPATPSTLAVPGAPPPYSSLPSSALKPKPILVDKQASEPNTPTSRHFERPMTRGYSDVSQRMKKRVTLSSLPSRHSLETKECPDLLQVPPPVVQVDLLAPPDIDDDDDDVDDDDPDEDSDPMDDDTAGLSIEYEPFVGSDGDSREGPATIVEENETSTPSYGETSFRGSPPPPPPLVIPTISASVSHGSSSPVVPPPSSLRPYHYPQHHHHNHHRHHHSSHTKYGGRRRHHLRGVTIASTSYGGTSPSPPPSPPTASSLAASLCPMPVREAMPPGRGGGGGGDAGGAGGGAGGGHESIELCVTETSRLLAPEIVTTVPMEESTS